MNNIKKITLDETANYIIQYLLNNYNNPLEQKQEIIKLLQKFNFRRTSDFNYVYSLLYKKFHNFSLFKIIKSKSQKEIYIRLTKAKILKITIKTYTI